MITETRRAFMKLVGVTTFNAPRVMADLPALLSAPSTLAAFAVDRSNSIGCNAALAPPSGTISGLVRRQIERMKTEVNDELYMRRAVRETKALDGDLQTMRSVSLVNKQRMQRERDGEYTSLVRQAEKVMYG